MLYEHHGENEMMTSFINVSACEYITVADTNITYNSQLVNLLMTSYIHTFTRIKNQSLTMRTVVYINLPLMSQWLHQKMKAPN